MTKLWIGRTTITKSESGPKGRVKVKETRDGYIYQRRCKVTDHLISKEFVDIWINLAFLFWVVDKPNITLFLFIYFWLLFFKFCRFCPCEGWVVLARNNVNTRDSLNTIGRIVLHQRITLRNLYGDLMLFPTLNRNFFHCGTGCTEQLMNCWLCRAYYENEYRISISRINVSGLRKRGYPNLENVSIMMSSSRSISSLSRTLFPKKHRRNYRFLNIQLAVWGSFR